MRQKTRKTSVLKYMTLPGILPRCKELFRTGFRYIAFLLASLYNTIGLLPNAHPYLNSSNVGRYSILNVIGEASNNLTLDRHNIDKIIMFVVTLVGIVLIFLQFTLLAVAMVMAPAFANAQPISFENIFTIDTNQTDLAYIALDMVFGVPGIYDSCIATGTPCSTDPADQILQGTGVFPWPFHTALHSMFQLYSMGLLVVAVMILIYFIIAVIAETAQSGTPFGRRFNQVWAPLRLVVALGLLVPLTTGLNSGQYITLYAAKMGSAMATNAWQQFNDDLAANNANGANLLGAQTQLIGKPNPPRVQNFLQFMHVAKACEITEERIGLRVATDSTGQATQSTEPVDIDLWLVRSDGSEPPPGVNGCNYGANDRAVRMQDTSSSCAWHFFGANDVTVRIGEREPDRYPSELGNVSRHCGEFVVPMANPSQPAGQDMTEGYYDLVVELWYGGGALADFEDITINNFFRREVSTDQIDSDANYTYEPFVLAFPPSDLKLRWASEYVEAVKAVIITAHNNLLASFDAAFTADLQEKGWAGAAIWYNKLAEVNGLFIDAVTQFPYVARYPALMEFIASERQEQHANASGDKYDKEVPGTPIQFPSNVQPDDEKYDFYYSVYSFWSTDPVTGSASYNAVGIVGSSAPTGNIVIDAINGIFGTAGLFDMRENASVHPLAQLVNLGKGIMNSTVAQIGVGVLGIGAQALSGAGPLGAVAGKLGGAASSFFFTISSIGLTAGFILFYVLPFLPFIYFFFAVMGWVKGIFEAMVGVPLWALAHIRIDGNGLPGDAAVNGYFLILEIIIRPILILFGLLASITIFAAAVQILNSIFDLVVSNLAGTDVTAENAGGGVVGLANAIPGVSIDYFRGPIDQFFYTVIYAVIVYLIGQSTFKMIDNIPNQILRWAGQSVGTFGDQRKDAAENLTQYAAIGGSQVFGQATGGLKSLGSAVGGASTAAGQGANLRT